MGVLGVLVLAVASVFGIPWIRLTLSTVSTDDAFVNGHVTFVAARVSGQIARVLVDDNNRVHKGDVLAQLDKEPYEDEVAVKRAAVDTATADLQVATASVRGLEAQARSLRWKLQYAIQDVDDRVAVLHARVAALEKSKATLKLAQLEFARAEKLLSSGTTTQQEYDRRQAALSVAQAEVTQAIADVHQIRVSLGLAAQPTSGDLGEVPPDLDQTFSSVREAQAALIQTAAQLGVVHSYEQLPKKMVEQFEKLDQGDVDRTLAGLTANAPAVKQAQAKLEAANRDLIQAELNLRYCDIVAEIDGVVTRRNVNPGNNVQVGQSLMAIRSLSEIWVDANFKETQLRDLRIGQACRSVCRHVRKPTRIQGAGLRIYDGNRIDAVIAAGRECYRQLHQSGPAAACSNRDRRIRPKRKLPIHRHIRRSLRLCEQAADWPRRREIPAKL